VSGGALALGRKRLTRGVLHLVLVPLALFFLIPVVVMIVTALQAGTQGGLSLVPHSLTFDNFRAVWEETRLPRLLVNSVIVTTSSTLIVLFFSSLAAFGFVQHPFVGARVGLLALLAGIMLPPAAIIVPLYTEIHNFGLLNNYLGLIGPYTALGLSVGILFFRNAFSAIPRDIVRAAKVDGASPWAIYRRIFLPLSLPAVATVAILQVLFSWNEFLIALLVMTKENRETAQLAYITYAGLYSASFEKQFAVLALLTIPVLVVFVVFQRQFVRGLTSGAIKG
jgi:raffinose/stachyose/melibiose transport system permease protein